LGPLPPPDPTSGSPREDEPGSKHPLGAPILCCTNALPRVESMIRPLPTLLVGLGSVVVVETLGSLVTVGSGDVASGVDRKLPPGPRGRRSHLHPFTGPAPSRIRLAHSPRRPQRKHSRSATSLPAPGPDHGYGTPRRHFDALPSRSSGTRAPSRLRTRPRVAHLRMSRAQNTPLEHLYSRTQIERSCEQAQESHYKSLPMNRLEHWEGVQR